MKRKAARRPGIEFLTFTSLFLMGICNGFKRASRRTRAKIRNCSCPAMFVHDRFSKNNKKGYRIIWSTGPEPVDQKMVVPTLSGLHAGQDVAQSLLLTWLNMSLWLVSVRLSVGTYMRTYAWDHEVMHMRAGICRRQ